MKNHKHLLMDFYLALLAIPMSDPFRVLNSSLYGEVLHSLSVQLDSKPTVVQGIFERMIGEDQPKPKYCARCNAKPTYRGMLCFDCGGYNER